MKLDFQAKYQESHEWVRPENELMVCGITDHAQNSLSDIVFVELPEVGKSLHKGDVFGTIESVKAASDLYMPMDGEIVAINEVLEHQPEIVNSDPFGEGWLMKFKPTSMAQWDELLLGEDYQKIVETE